MGYTLSKLWDVVENVNLCILFAAFEFMVNYGIYFE